MVNLAIDSNHSLTAAASLSVTRLSRSRDNMTETCGSRLGKNLHNIANRLEVDLGLLVNY